MRPMRQNSNEKALLFGNPSKIGEDRGLQSQIYMETAGQQSTGRSSTNQHLHCSEVAFWPNAGLTISGLFQTVPTRPGTSIILESTANGMTGKGEEFYERWMRAEAEQGKPGARFHPIFFPWFWNPEYELDDSEFSPDKFEIELKRKFPQITDRKLAWRRYKIQNDMGSATLSPEDQFRQEYPASSQEAFLASGRPVFPAEKVRDHIERLRGRTVKRGTFDGSGRFIERSDGPYRIFVPMRPEGIYAIGGDVAEGLVTGDF